MSLGTISFHGARVDSQEYGSDDEHMVSRVYFDLFYDGKVLKDLHCDVKQTVGAPYDTAPLEVAMPEFPQVMLQHRVVAPLAERYYRWLFGTSGSGSGVIIGMMGPGSRIMDFTIERLSPPMQFSINIKPKDTATW